MLPLVSKTMFFDLHSGRWWRADLFVCTAHSVRVNPGPNNRGDILNTAHCYVAVQLAREGAAGAQLDCGAATEMLLGVELEQVGLEQVDGRSV